MQVKELKKDGLKREMEVTLPASDIDSRTEGKLKEIGKTIRMPGFRPGKAPMNILKKKYGKAIMGEVLELAVNETSAKVLKDKDLKPALQPKIEVKSFDDGKDLVFTMAVEILPTFEVKGVKGAKLTKLVARPDDKAVEEALNRIAEGHQGTKPIEGKRGAKEGDTVVIDFHGRTADDNKEHPGMHAHGHHLKLGSGQFIPGFEDQLKGAKAGEKVEVKLTFPKDYGAKELAGRDAIFDVDVHEIREPAEAKIDDEFAKSFGKDSVAELKDAVREQLQKEYDYHSRLHLKKGLMDHLDEANDFDVPEGMLEAEFKNIMDQVEMDRRRHGAEKKEISQEEKDELKEIAERRVRLGLILAEVGKGNNITVSDPELQRGVINEAKKFPGQERQVFDYYAKNRNALESLRAPLFEEKVVDYMLELAAITEKTVTPEDLINALEDEEEQAKKEKPKAGKAKEEKAAKSGAKPKKKK